VATHRTPPPPPPAPEAGDEDAEPDIARIAAIIKDCDQAEAIAARVLDRPDMLNKVLLCLWAVNRFVNPNMGLTSGDVEKITDQLHVRISTPNASKTLSGRANAFVSGDSVRKQGSAVHYRINRRGLQAFEAVLSGN
jgi:hypothetical protein